MFFFRLRPGDYMYPATLLSLPQRREAEAKAHVEAEAEAEAAMTF